MKAVKFSHQKNYFSLPFSVWSLLMVLLVGGVVYARVLSYPFLFDDDLIKGHGVISMITSFYQLKFRFLPYLTFGIQNDIHGVWPQGYRLINILLHIVNSWMVGQLFLALLKTPYFTQLKQSKNNVSKKTLSFLTPFFDQVFEHQHMLSACISLVFLLHPLQTQAVVYISQRLASMVTLFYLLSTYGYIQVRIQGIKRRNKKSFPYSQKAVYKWLFVTVLSGLLAFFTKENSLSLPISLMVIEFYFFVGKRNWRVYSTVISISIVILAVIIFEYLGMGRLGAKVSPLGETITSFKYAVTQFPVRIEYLRLFLIPIGQNADHQFAVIFTILQTQVVLALLIHLFLAIAIVVLFFKHRLLSFGLIWFFVTQLVESSIVPIEDVMVEHRLYLSMFGLAILLVISGWTIFYFFFDKGSQTVQSRLFLQMMGLILIVYTVLTINRSSVWASKQALWSDVVSKSPDKARGFAALGEAYAEQGVHDQALWYFIEALKRNTYSADLSARIHNNIGLSLEELGRLDEAVGAYQEAIEMYPQMVQAYYNLFDLYLNLGEEELAIATLEKALIHIPQPPPSLYHNLGIAYRKQGKPGKAKRMFEKLDEMN